MTFSLPACHSSGAFTARPTPAESHIPLAFEYYYYYYKYSPRYYYNFHRAL